MAAQRHGGHMAAAAVFHRDRRPSPAIFPGNRWNRKEPKTWTETLAEAKKYYLQKWKTINTITWIVGAIASFVIERLAFKMLLDNMGNYRFLLPQAVAIAYVPFFTSLLVYQWNALPQGGVVDETWDFSKQFYFAMAFLDIVKNYLLMLPGGEVPAPLTVVFPQMTTPVMLLGMVLIYRSQFHARHILGATIIFFGVLLAATPIFMDWSVSVSAIGTSGKQSESFSVGINSLLYMLAAFPATFSMLYKEKVLSSQPVDPVLLNAWVCTLQVLVGIILCPLAFNLQHIGNGWESAPLSELPSDICDGIKCLLSMPTSKGENCSGVFLLFTCYIAATVVQQQLLTRLVVENPCAVGKSATTGVPCAFVALVVYAITHQKPLSQSALGGHTGTSNQSSHTYSQGFVSH